MPPESSPPGQRRFADEGEVITTFTEIRAALKRIEEQTTRTNGRVQKLEQFSFAAKTVIGLLILQAGWVIAIVLNMRGN